MPPPHLKYSEDSLKAQSKSEYIWNKQLLHFKFQYAQLHIL